MIHDASRKKKWIAIGSVAVLSTGLGSLSRMLLGLMNKGIIEKENLEEILTQIESADINTGALVSVLNEPPPLLFIFIVSIIGTALTVWLYHKVLCYLCNSDEKEINPNKSSEPIPKTAGD